MRLLDDENFRWKVIINSCVIGFALFTVSRERPVVDTATGFERFMINTLSPVQSGLTEMKHGIANFFDDYVTNISASRKNRELEKEVQNLKSELFSYSEMAKENERLKELLQFGEAIPRVKVLAQIVGWDASRDHKSIRINKGKKDGIKLLSSVVTSQGLVGYIYRMTENFSDILTVLDGDNKVDGIVERTRSHGIVEGLSKQSCIMKYVARTEPIELDDLVLTSGLGNIYPKGIRIGSVKKIARDSFGISQEVVISPSVDFGQLEEVIVLIAPTAEQMQKEWNALNAQEKLEKGEAEK